MATCAQLQTWLAEVEQARQSLALGALEVFISTGPKQLRFEPTDEAALARREQTLRLRIQACTGVRDTGIRTAIKFIPRDDDGNCRGPFN